MSAQPAVYRSGAGEVAALALDGIQDRIRSVRWLLGVVPRKHHAELAKWVPDVAIVLHCEDIRRIVGLSRLDIVSRLRKRCAFSRATAYRWLQALDEEVVAAPRPIWGWHPIREGGR